MTTPTNQAAAKRLQTIHDFLSDPQEREVYALAIAALLRQGEGPVRLEFRRSRNPSGWGPWSECDQGQYEAMASGEWDSAETGRQYEVRALYAAPPSQPALKSPKGDLDAEASGVVTEAMMRAAEEIEQGHVWITAVAASAIIRRYAAALLPEKRESNLTPEPGEGRALPEAVAYLQPETLNSADPEGFRTCRDAWPDDYRDWFPVYTAAQLQEYAAAAVERWRKDATNTNTRLLSSAF